VSLDAQDWVWEHSSAKGTARLVLLAIADKASGPECSAYAGTTLLVKRANAARSSVVVAVDKLIESGELQVVEGRVGPRGETWYCLPKAVGHRREGGPKSGPVRNPDPSENRTPTGPESGPQGSENRTPTGPESGPQNTTKPKPPERTHTEDRASAPADSSEERDYAWKAFGDFWLLYPRPMQPEKTKTAWRAALDRGADPGLIVKAAQAYAKHLGGKADRYTPYSATWLNNGSYEDPIAEPAPPSGPHRNPQNDSDYEQGWN
jgi:hypothetical protein